MGRSCAWCGGRIGPTKRPQTKTCSTRCRVALHRSTRPSGVPVELRSRPRWVRHTAKKMPIQLDGRPASSTDPATWTTYNRIRSFVTKGFVLDGDGVVCIDLDHCLDGDRMATWAAELLALAPDTYIEVSASGTGLHVFGYAQVGQGRKIRDHRNIEVYGTGRYIAVTGHRFGTSSRLADLSGLLSAITP
jgi:primase-polymerase (primpol)-like protein